MPSPSPASPDSTPTVGRIRRHATRGRGSSTNPANRFEGAELAVDPDAWSDTADPSEQPAPATRFYLDDTQSILSANDSPDLPSTYSVNPYRGCEHGCAYCYARTYHDYLGWSSGLDFETRILVKQLAPSLLRAALSAPKWQPQPIAFSGATDCYQPAERHFQLTRQCLEILAVLRNPVGIITKSALVTRDIDLLRTMSAWNGVHVYVSITSLDPEFAGRLEPRAARPAARLDAIRQLADAGIPVGVMTAPIIPGLNDVEIPAILRAAGEAGARTAGKVVLRLPHALKELFTDWLETHYPGQRDRVLARVRALRGGALNVSTWGERMRGEGIHAEQIHRLWEVGVRRAGLDRGLPPLNTGAFRRPGGDQLDLFSAT